jgi:O-antigen ligase
MSDLSTAEIALGAGGIVALAAYVVLIFVPAWGSYGRWWERIAAGFMTLFILATLLGIGVGVGAAIFWTYDHWA